MYSEMAQNDEVGSPASEAGSATAPDSSASAEPDATARPRILAATAEVLGRKGHIKLSLSDVASKAQVSRTTLYKWFPSKHDLLAAFAEYELHNVNTGFANAVNGLAGTEKLEAAIRYIAEFQRTYPLKPMVDIEPHYVNTSMSWVLPIIREWLRPLLAPGETGDLAAACAARMSVCHFLISSDDTDQLVAQLRYTLGLTHSPTA